MAVNGVNAAHGGYGNIENFDGSEPDEVYRTMFRNHIARQLRNHNFRPRDDDIASLRYHAQFPNAMTSLYQVPMRLEEDTLYGALFNIGVTMVRFEETGGKEESERLRLDFTLMPVERVLDRHPWFLDILRRFGHRLGGEAEAAVTYFECPLYLRRTDAASHQALRLFGEDYFMTCHPSFTRAYSKVVGLTIAAAFRLFTYLLAQHQKALLHPGMRPPPLGIILVRSGENHMLNFARFLSGLDLFIMTECVFGFCPFWAADLGPGSTYELRPGNERPAGIFTNNPDILVERLSRPRTLVPDSPFDALRIVILPANNPDGQWLEDTLMDHPSPRMQPRYIIRRLSSAEVADRELDEYPEKLVDLRLMASTCNHAGINANPTWPWPHGQGNSQANRV